MMKSFAAVAATLVVAPALASAQPYAPIPMPPPPQVVVVQQQPVAPVATDTQEAPPQNAAWSDLSHINGQLVPVGTKNEYFTAPLRKTNISVNPIGALFGFYGASASYAISNNVAIRGDFELFDISDFKGTEVNVTAPIYLRKTYTGLFIEPGVMVRTLQDTSYDCYETCTETMTTKTSYGPEVMIGYHYMTDSGFNVAAAFGVMRNLNKETSNDPYSSSSDEIDVQPAGYFRVGYAF